MSRRFGTETKNRMIQLHTRGSTYVFPIGEFHLSHIHTYPHPSHTHPHPSPSPLTYTPSPLTYTHTHPHPSHTHPHPSHTHPHTLCSILRKKRCTSSSRHKRTSVPSCRQKKRTLSRTMRHFNALSALLTLKPGRE